MNNLKSKNNRIFALLLLAIVLITACKKNEKDYLPMQGQKSIAHKVTVKEVLQTGDYTFLNVTENQEDFWMAIGKTNVKAGEVVYYEDAMEMKNFKSKELDRTFDRILFADGISNAPIISKITAKDSLYHKKRISKPVDKIEEDIQVEVAEGGITIEELYKNGKKYENKKVLVRGQVVKTNNGIMDRNWVHLKDGTNNEGKSDLTFTTQAQVKVGDVVTFEGVVALDKEFGAGYVYPLVVEQAVLKQFSNSNNNSIFRKKYTNNEIHFFFTTGIWFDLRCLLSIYCWKMENNR